jgi:hypothetical protein
LSYGSVFGERWRKPVDMLHNPHECRSVRFPIDGGTLVRFDFLTEI